MRLDLSSLFALSLLLATVAAALAQIVPVGPYTSNSQIAQMGPGGGGLPIGRGGSSGGGGSAACANSLDFSQACNSQYIEAIGQ